MKPRTLPLGVDLGRQRIRVALCERTADDTVTLVAVAARASADDPAAALRDAVRELGTRERRCVVGIGAPDATLRAIELPELSPFERRRAARFEAARLGADAHAIVTLSPLSSGWALGYAPRAALDERRAAARAAGLRVVAIDDTALALARVCGAVDGAIDIGCADTRIAIFADPLPYVIGVAAGGDALTAAIADALAVDALRAEERKRTSGFSGAGEARRDELIADVVDAIESARSSAGVAVRSLAMTGNGSRIPGLAEACARASGIAIRLAEISPALSETLPGDVLRAAGPDWSLAVGLALWADAA